MSRSAEEFSGPSIGAEKFTDEFLESLRSAGDEPADDAVATFFESYDATKTSLFPVLMRTHHAELDDEDVPGVGAFAKAREPWPDWVDPDLVKEGQEVFGQWGLQMASGLFMASLPMSYACAKGAVPLVRTARLTSNPKRRFLETGQMIIDAMTPKSLEPGHRGYRTVRHIRLMHAAVRHTLTNTDELAVLGAPKLDPWDYALGTPLNQEDLLGCLFAFNVLGIQSLERAGVSITAREKEAYIHAWNLVGFQIGVRADLLPLNLADATTVANAIFKRQNRKSAEGQELTATGILAMQELINIKRLNGLPASGIRFYLGDEVAEMLGVPAADWTLGAFKFMLRFDHSVSPYLTWMPGKHSMSGFLGRRIIAGLEDAERGGGRPKFEITDELRESWGDRVEEVEPNVVLDSRTQQTDLQYVARRVRRDCRRQLDQCV